MSKHIPEHVIAKLNLPELPEGHYWRAYYPHPDLLNGARVAIFKRRWPFVVVVASGSSFPANRPGSTWVELYQQAADYALEQHQRRNPTTPRRIELDELWSKS